MPSPLNEPAKVTVTAIPTANQDDKQLATELAEERYTAARRQYTHLHVESLGSPDRDVTEALAAARAKLVASAAALREVEDGNPDAIRQELEAGPVSEDERALTTDKLTIAELNRAAAAPPASWDWKP